MAEREKFNVPQPSCIDGPPVPWALTPEEQKGLFFSEDTVVPEFPEIEDLRGPAGNPGEQGPPSWIDGPLIPLVVTPEEPKGPFLFPENMEVVKDD